MNWTARGFSRIPAANRMSGKIPTVPSDKPACRNNPDMLL